MYQGRAKKADSDFFKILIYDSVGRSMTRKHETTFDEFILILIIHKKKLEYFLLFEAFIKGVDPLIFL